jgi:hypothetical protein
MSDLLHLATQLVERVKHLEAENQRLREVPKYPGHMGGNPVTAQVSEYNYDMESAPVGGKLIVLNHSGCATFSVLTSDDKQYFQAWAPMPKRKK